MIRWIRRLAGLLALVFAVYQLIAAWRRPLLGFMPWGDPTGLQIKPLVGAAAAAARAREEALALRWEGDLTPPRNV